MEFQYRFGCFIHLEKSLLLRKKLTVLTLTLEPPTSSPLPQTQLNQHHTKTHTQKLPPIYITQWLSNKSTLIMNVATSHWKWCWPHHGPDSFIHEQYSFQLGATSHSQRQGQAFRIHKTGRFDLSFRVSCSFFLSLLLLILNQSYPRNDSISNT